MSEIKLTKLIYIQCVLVSSIHIKATSFSQHMLEARKTADQFATSAKKRERECRLDKRIIKISWPSSYLR